MATFLIRNLGDAVAQRLRMRAIRERISFEEAARRVLDEGSHSTRAEIVCRAQRLREGHVDRTSAADLLRVDRNR